MRGQFQKLSQNMQNQGRVPSGNMQSGMNLDLHQEECLRKTIEIKNKNIDELLKQLKETKQLYLEYKNQYLSQQRKLKAKVGDLSARLDLQFSQVQKLKALNVRIRGDLQTARQKQQKSTQSYMREIRQKGLVMDELDRKYNEMKVQNQNLREKNQLLGNRCAQAEEKCRKMEIELSRCREECERIQEQMRMKEERWQLERQQRSGREIQKESRKGQKVRFNSKLSEIQNRIKDTLRKM